MKIFLIKLSFLGVVFAITVLVTMEDLKAQATSQNIITTVVTNTPVASKSDTKGAHADAHIDNSILPKSDLKSINLSDPKEIKTVPLSSSEIRVQNLNTQV